VLLIQRSKAAYTDALRHIAVCHTLFSIQYSVVTL
jgi:hypothetical protein